MLDVGQTNRGNHEPETMLNKTVRVKVWQLSAKVIHRKASPHREMAGRIEYDVRTLTLSVTVGTCDVLALWFYQPQRVSVRFPNCGKPGANARRLMGRTTQLAK
jgi:hypothetical protein